MNANKGKVVVRVGTTDIGVIRESDLSKIAEITGSRIVRINNSCNLIDDRTIGFEVVEFKYENKDDNKKKTKGRKLSEEAYQMLIKKLLISYIEKENN